MTNSLKLLLLTVLFIQACGSNNNSSDASNTNKKKYKPIEQEAEFKIDSSTLYGSLILPDSSSNEKFPLIFFIAGSGPTNRDGNSMMGLQTNCYKMFCDTIATKGFASLRFDKRGVGKSIGALKNESNLVFSDMVNDAKKWIENLKNNGRFSKIIIAGHSEGALIGSIISNQTKVDGFLSICGTAQSADSILAEQLSNLPNDLKNESLDILSKLKKGEDVENVSMNLKSIFRPSIQPYLRDWFRYHPKKEMAKITIPTLIIGGSTDIQVKAEEANQLGKANPNAKVVVIENMNHVLKEVGEDKSENLKTYNNPKLPLHKEFVVQVFDFLENHLELN